MAKRDTGINSKHTTGPRKTKKRLEIKRQHLIELASKKRRHNRKVRSIASLNLGF